VLESDGIHLTAVSGYQFVHHLFDASFKMIEYAGKSTNQKVIDDHAVLATHDSRIGILENQFSAFRDQRDLDFAIQQELNDWAENEINQNFFVITGLATPPAKMSGGTYYSFSALARFV
jgi:hypothetical protein